jgi:hypothetical protein
MCGSTTTKAIVVLVTRNLGIYVQENMERTYFLRFGTRLKSCPKVEVNLLSKGYTSLSFVTYVLELHGRI